MGTFKNSAFKAAAIYDPATGDTAQMNTLVSPETKFYEPEIIEQPITNGAYQSSWRFKVDFASSDWDAYDQLRTFKDAYTEVRAVAAGAGKGSKNLQWYESVQIAELRRVPKGLRSEGDSFFIVSLVFIGGENAAIYNNVNLLHQANVNGVTVTGFVDSDSDNIADGYTSGNLEDVAVTFTGLSFSGTTQAVTSNFKDYLFRNIVFPISGLEITYSSGGSNAYPNIIERNISGTSINSYQSLVTANATHQFETDDALYDLVVRIMQNSNSNGLSSTIIAPRLRTDGETTYIAG